MKTIYIFGNPYLQGDNFAVAVGKELTFNFDDKYNIVHCSSPESLLDAEGKITIIDVVKDIKEPILINDISKLKTKNIISLHDFDVAFFLQLMQELGKDLDVKIIGIPVTGDAKQIANEVQKWID